MFATLAKNWWAFAIRGLLGVLFGIIAFAWPGVTMLSLVIVFAAYAITDGVFAIIAAVRAASHHERWTLFLLEGIVGIVAGVLAFMWPGLTVIVFVTLVAFWALLSGGLMLAAAFRLDTHHGRWWFALGGVASIIYGVLLLIAPVIGALVLTWWIGAYALVFGIAMLIAAFRLRTLAHGGASLHTV
ncbi:MAG TPA: HdeD family acid-resistance protein [Rhizomicrobium sp.]|nr:HdeD family acid-resistance protein [Rhizomicrobium sp.]